MPFRPYNREQEWLLPPSLSELIPEDHPARFVLEFVSQLAWGELGIAAEPPVEGAPAYAPEILLLAWLYGFMVRVRSSRKLERACRENVVFMWLTGLQRPDHSTLSRFYQRNRQAMRPLLKQTVQLAVRVGLVDFAFQAVDGTRLASAARPSWRSGAATAALLQQVEQEIAAMEAANAQEDSTEGLPPAGPRQRLGREQMRTRLRQALAELERRTAAPGGRHDAAGTSSSDPEAGLLKAAQGYVVGYNAQTVVDGRAQIVVAAEVTACSSDGEHLVPMVREAQAMTGQVAEVVGADSGYFAIGSVVAAEQQGCEVFVPVPRRKETPEQERYAKAHFRYEVEGDRFICPEGQILSFSHQEGSRHGKAVPSRVYAGEACGGCAAQHSGACTRAPSRRVRRYPTDDVRARYLAQMETERAKEMMRKRAATVEPVYAHTQECLGVLRFLRRGWENVRAEWRFTCAVHNLLKLWRYWWRLRLQGLACPP